MCRFHLISLLMCKPFNSQMSKEVYKLFEMYIYRVDLVVKDIRANIIILFTISSTKKSNFTLLFSLDLFISTSCLLKTRYSLDILTVSLTYQLLSLTRKQTCHIYSFRICVRQSRFYLFKYTNLK